MEGRGEPASEGERGRGREEKREGRREGERQGERGRGERGCPAQRGRPTVKHSALHRKPNIKPSTSHSSLGLPSLQGSPAVKHSIFTFANCHCTDAGSCDKLRLRAATVPPRKIRDERIGVCSLFARQRKGHGPISEASLKRPCPPPGS